MPIGYVDVVWALMVSEILRPRTPAEVSDQRIKAVREFLEWRDARHQTPLRPDC